MKARGDALRRLVCDKERSHRKQPYGEQCDRKEADGRSRKEHRGWRQNKPCAETDQERASHSGARHVDQRARVNLSGHPIPAMTQAEGQGQTFLHCGRECEAMVVTFGDHGRPGSATGFKVGSCAEVTKGPWLERKMACRPVGSAFLSSRCWGELSKHGGVLFLFMAAPCVKAIPRCAMCVRKRRGFIPPSLRLAKHGPQLVRLLNSRLRINRLTPGVEAQVVASAREILAAAEVA